MADSIFDVIFGNDRFKPKRDFDIFGYKDEYTPEAGTKSVPFYEQERQFKTLPKAQSIEEDPFRFNYEQPVGADILTRAGNVALPMTVEGIKQSFTGGLDALMDLGGSIPTTAKEKRLEDVGVMDFNVYNAYKDRDPGQGFTDAFREAGIFSLPTDVQEKMREYSPASDLFKYGANIASGGLFTKAITGKIFSDAINFGLPGITFDLNDPNFGQIFQELGADNEVVDWLAGDGKNEDAQARIEQRLKNTLTETGLSYLVDQGIRVIRNAKDLIKNPEYRKQVVEDTASGLVDTRSPIDKINESLYNIKAISSGNKNLVQTDPRFGSQMSEGFRYKTEGTPTDYFETDKVQGIARDSGDAGLGAKFVDYDLVDKQGAKFYRQTDMTYGNVRVFYNADGNIESISTPQKSTQYMYNEKRQNEAIGEFFEGLKDTQNTNKQITIRDIPRKDIEKYRALGVKFDGFGDPYEYKTAKGKFNVNDLDIKAFQNYTPGLKTDEAGFYLRSEKILEKTDKDSWKNPDEVFMEGKKGKSGLLKDVPKQELEETGVLDMIAKAKAEGKPITKSGLLAHIESNKPELQKSSGMGSGMNERQFNDYDLDARRDELEVLDMEDSWAVDRQWEIKNEILESQQGANDFVDWDLQKLTDAEKQELEPYIEKYMEIVDDLNAIQSTDEFRTATGTQSRLLMYSPEQKDIVNDLAEAMAELEYSKDPEYGMTIKSDFPNAPEFRITGNDEMGYTIYDDAGNFITEGQSYREANVQLDEHLREIMDTGDYESDVFWQEYASPGYFDPQTYKEINAQVTQKDLEYPHSVEPHSLPGNEDESLFFTRTTEREIETDDGYRNALHIDEIQSDWHQQLRKFGIDPEQALNKVNNAKEALETLNSKFSVVDDQYNQASKDLNSYQAQTLESFIDSDNQLRPYKKEILDALNQTPVKDDIDKYSFSFGNGDPISIGYFKRNFSRKFGLEGTLLPSFLNVYPESIALLNKKVLTDYKKLWGKVDLFAKEKSKLVATTRKLQEFIKKSPSKMVETSPGVYDEVFTGVGGTKPPLANEKWEETALKMSIMDAIDRGIDYVTWTPSDIQIAVWSDKYAELYKNVYDKRLPKNAKKFIKEFGGELHEGSVHYGEHEGEFIGNRKVYYIKITPELKANIGKEGGLPLYQYGAPVPLGLLGMENQDNGRIDENKGLLQ